MPTTWPTWARVAFFAGLALLGVAQVILRVTAPDLHEPPGAPQHHPGPPGKRPPPR